MDFDHAADSAPPLSHPREDAAHGEDETTPDSDVRNIDSQPGDVSSMTDSKGDLNVAKVTEGYAKEDLLDLDPYGRKSPESEQAAPATGDSGLATNKLQNENPLGLPTHSAQDADILKPQERDHDEIGGSEDTPTHISSDTPAYASNPLSNDPISTTPEYFSVHGNAGDEAAIPILSDGSSAPMFESSGRKDSLSPDQPLESGTVETENDHVDPALDAYSNEPTPKSDASFELPIVSTAATTADLSAESSNPVISDSIFRPINSSVTPGDLRSVSPAEKDPPTPEQTQILPKSDSPVLLETATKPDTSAIESNPNPDVPAAEAPAPYINPDPFQDYIPPVEKNELGDHRSARIPSPSSMDAEPPTPIERSALSSIKDSEELIDAERVVDNLPIEALRNRDVQAALASASVIPPAPDKPLPPTPGSESRAPVGCLGHQPGGLLADLLLRVVRDPRVMEILLWRDPKKSGAAFATGLVLLFSMIYCSFISVVAYFALALLTVTLGFRLYKTVMAMVQKTNDGHPFQDLLSVDTTVTTEKGHELSDRAVAELNCCSSTLKDLFLVKDIFESVKFGFVLYLLTYLGAWFNTMTLVIIGYVAMFTLPKVYEQNKEKIDEVLGQVKEKVGEISAKVKAAIPMGKKAAVEPITEEKKEE